MHQKYPQWYNPWFGASREWQNDVVASIVYMIQHVYININVDKNDIISLLAGQDSEDCMDTPSTFNIRDSYVFKSQSHNPDTPTYMEASSGENMEEYVKAIDNEIQNLMRSDTWEIC